MTTLIGYGCLYYSFGAVLPAMAVDLRLSEATLSIAFSTSTLLSAALAPLVGRTVDVAGGGRLMLGGSVTAVAGLIGAAHAHELTGLVIAWAVIGVGASMTLYDAAFAYVVRASAGTSPDRQLLLITVVGGLASAIFVPLLGAVTSSFGWRHALLVAAGVVGAVNVPIHVSLMRREGRSPGGLPAPRRPANGPVGARFLLSRTGATIGFSLWCQGLISGAAAAYLVSGILGQGLPSGAAYGAVGAFGLAAVAGRLLLGRGGGPRRRLPTVMVRLYAAQAAALLLLAWETGLPGVAVGAGAVLGAASGLASLARPRLVLRHAGTRGFGAASGALGALSTLAKGAGPVAGGLALTLGGSYRALWAALCAAAICSTVIGWLPEPGADRAARTTGSD